jgi:hypothetical protein
VRATDELCRCSSFPLGFPDKSTRGVAKPGERSARLRSEDGGRHPEEPLPALLRSLAQIRVFPCRPFPNQTLRLSSAIASDLSVCPLLHS